MKKERILKTIVVLIIGAVLFAMTTNVFAADVDFFEDTTNQLNTVNTNTDNTTNTATNNTATNTVNTTNTTTNTNTNTNTNTVNTTNTTSTVNTTTTTANTNNYNTNLPKAGAPENTMVGVAITVLAVVAVFAYKKINQYKNI